jgi:hypothetical protein
MMGASGVLSTKNAEPGFRPWRFVAAAAVGLTAATRAVAGDQRPAAESAHGAHLLIAQSDAFTSLGVGDYAGDLSDLAPAAAPAPALDEQDRFEVERLFRLSGAR